MLHNQEKHVNNRFKLAIVVTAIAILLWNIFSLIVFYFPAYADSDEPINSGVLADLQKDETFDKSKYPEIGGGYSLHVIHIGESELNELFVYVYQPCGNSKDLRASSIRISTTVGDNAKWMDYSLTYVSNEETIYKYRVDKFQVNSDNERYYDISAISRQWDKLIDSGSGTDMTINEVSYPVGQLWTVSTLADSTVTYSMRETDVVELTDLYASSIRYSTGHAFYGKKACDIFYVAFSADHDIDELKEADVDFTYYKYIYDTGTMSGSAKLPNSAVHEVAYLEADATTEYGGYSWKWIQSSSDFLEVEGENLSSKAKAIIKKQQWVLLYFGCELTIMPIGPLGRPSGYSYRGYTTESVSVLRLKFEYDGVTYNLGVVSDKVTGAFPYPQKKESLWDKIIRWVKQIMAWLFGLTPADIPDWAAVVFLIVGIVLLIILIIVLIPFLPLIGSGILYALKGLWWVIKLPFKLIAKLFTGDKT